MQLIAELEGERRGLYGGAAGYIGYDGNLDTAITIRSAVLKDGVAHVHTGAGIVAGSRAGARVRGDRAQGRRHASGHRAGRAGRRAQGRAGHAAALGRSEGVGVILVIDNYDSFTFNLVQALEAAGARRARRAQRPIDRAGIEALATDPAADLRGHRHLARTGQPGHGRRLGRRSRSPPSMASRCSASASGIRASGRLRWPRRARADPRPRRGARSSTTAWPARRPAVALLGRALHSLCVDPATLPPELGSRR